MSTVIQMLSASNAFYILHFLGTSQTKPREIGNKAASENPVRFNKNDRWDVEIGTCK